MKVFYTALHNHWVIAAPSLYRKKEPNWTKLTIVKRSLFSDQLPEHDAEPVDVKLHSSGYVDVPVLRRYVRHGPTQRSAVGVICREVPPLGQAKVAYLPSVYYQKL